MNFVSTTSADPSTTVASSALASRAGPIRNLSWPSGASSEPSASSKQQEPSCDPQNIRGCLWSDRLRKLSTKNFLKPGRRDASTLSVLARFLELVIPEGTNSSGKRVYAALKKLIIVLARPALCAQP